MPLRQLKGETVFCHHGIKSDQFCSSSTTRISDWNRTDAKNHHKCNAAAHEIETASSASIALTALRILRFIAMPPALSPRAERLTVQKSK